MALVEILSSAPRAWKDFTAYYYSTIELKGPEQLLKINFLDLPFEFQFGLLYSYLQEQGVDIPVTQWNEEELKDLIVEHFEDLEKLMDHFS